MLFEYVSGGELFSRLRREGRFANDVALFYACEILLALQFLHKRNIVYRDLKPENLLIDHEGHIKLADFGFAKYLEDDRTFTLCGTPEYLAPEIVKGSKKTGYGKSVDWWALGILLFEMLAGYPPFYDCEPIGIYKKILAGIIEFPKFFSLRTKDLIRKLLNPEIKYRLGCKDVSYILRILGLHHRMEKT
jgi:serine/threonine protein kinase